MSYQTQLFNQDTRTFSDTQFEHIVLQNCQTHFSQSQKHTHQDTDHQFDTISQDPHFHHSQTQPSQQESNLGFKGKFQIPSTTSQVPSSPTKTAQPPAHIFQTPSPQKSRQSPKGNKYLEKKKHLEEKSQEFQRNFKHQQKLFALCFEYMNESVANRIAEESGIATDAFIKRKKHAEKNHKMIEKFMEMMDCDSMSSWSSNTHQKRKNWFRRVSRRDVRTVIDFLLKLDKDTDPAHIDPNEKMKEIEPEKLQSPAELDNNQQLDALIAHLKTHSLFIQNLPPKISYSELEKYLEEFGQIVHFLILDNFGRRKSNDPVPGQNKQNEFSQNRRQEQSKIIGFVEFDSQGPVQAMLQSMEQRKLRYFVKTVDKIANEPDRTEQLEQPQRKTSIYSDQFSLQQEQEQKQNHISRKIYVRQVQWSEMLKPQQFSKVQQRRKDDLQNTYKKNSVSQNFSPVIQSAEQKPLSDIPSVIQEGWQEIAEQTREESQTKTNHLEKLNMLRLKLRLIKSATSVKQQVTESTVQGQLTNQFNQVQQGNSKQVQTNLPTSEKNDTLLPVEATLMPIIEETPENNQQQQSTQNNSDSKQTQTQTIATTLNQTQTECHRLLQTTNSQQKDPAIDPTKRCEECENRQIQKSRRSIEQQIHITVGVNFSCQVPFRSAFCSFHHEEKVRQKQAQRPTETLSQCNEDQNILHSSEKHESSSSCVDSIKSPIHKSEKAQFPKPKSLFDYSLWDSDQDHAEMKKNSIKSQTSGQDNISLERNMKINQRIEENGLSSSPIVNYPIVEQASKDINNLGQNIKNEGQKVSRERQSSSQESKSSGDSSHDRSNRYNHGRQEQSRRQDKKAYIQSYGRNYERRNEEQRKPRFPTFSSREDNRSKRNPQKQATSNRKWKYSDYVEEPKSASRNRREQKRQEEINY